MLHFSPSFKWLSHGKWLIDAYHKNSMLLNPSLEKKGLSYQKSTRLIFTIGNDLNCTIDGFEWIACFCNVPREHIGDDGDDGMTIEQEWVDKGRAFFMHGPPGPPPKKPNEGSLAKPGVIHPPSGKCKLCYNTPSIDWDGKNLSGEQLPVNGFHWMLPKCFVYDFF